MYLSGVVNMIFFCLWFPTVSPHRESRFRVGSGPPLACSTTVQCHLVGSVLNQLCEDFRVSCLWRHYHVTGRLLPGCVGDFRLSLWPPAARCHMCFGPSIYFSPRTWAIIQKLAQRGWHGIVARTEMYYYKAIKYIVLPRSGFAF